MDKKIQKEFLDKAIQQKTEELNRFKNMEALLLADIASFEKQKQDLDRDYPEA